MNRVSSRSEHLELFETGATGNYTEPLTESQLATNSPYNTRLYTGLPPGPINSPGLASIEAAAHPAKVGYLFYVVKPGTCGRVRGRRLVWMSRAISRSRFNSACRVISS